MKRIWLAWLLFATPFAVADISVVNSSTVADGGTFTAGAGANRLLLWMTGGRHSTTDFTQTSATHAAVSMTEAAEAPTAAGAGNVGIDTAISYLKEAQIVAGAQAADVDWSSAPSNNTGAMITLAGVNQSNPIVDVQTFIATTSGTSVPLPTVDVVAGGIVIIAVQNGSQDFSTVVGYTTILNNTGSPPRVYTSYKLIVADGTESGVAPAHSANNRRSGVIISLRPVSGCTGTEYGLDGGLVDLTWDAYGAPTRLYASAAPDVADDSLVCITNVVGAGTVSVAADGGVTATDTVTSFDWDYTVAGTYTGSAATWELKGLPPIFGASSIPSQIYAKDKAILPYDLDDYFVFNGASVSAFTLKQLSAPSATDQANGTGVDSLLLTVDDVTGIAVGDWIKVGSAAYSRVKYIDPINQQLGLWGAITWADNDAVSVMSVGNCAISGLSINASTHNFEGTPDTAETNALCVFRATDTAGLIGDSP